MWQPFGGMKKISNRPKFWEYKRLFIFPAIGLVFEIYSLTLRGCLESFNFCHEATKSQRFLKFLCDFF
jgi:hypothetical protein